MSPLAGRVNVQERPLRIGLSARLLHNPPPELGFPGKILQYLEQSMAHWVMSHGALAYMIPTIGFQSEVARKMISVRDFVQPLDGLILQGGADVSPLSYGEEAELPEWTGDRVRDLYEIELIREFMMQGKPVLGVCRGCQLINVAMGGTLWRDIQSQVEGAIPHRDTELYDGYHHAIKLLPGTRLAAMYPDQDEALVNSIHHQCVRKLGNDLVVEAVSADDGIVEAIRHSGKTFLVGVQWHPEFHRAGGHLLDGGAVVNEFLMAARDTLRGTQSTEPA
jgi:gamma-glutamyl-gamma-aminobutyrate hydrolase PuuD